MWVCGFACVRISQTGGEKSVSSFTALIWMELMVLCDPVIQVVIGDPTPVYTNLSRTVHKIIIKKENMAS